MRVPKPTDADKERFRRLIPHEPRVEVKPMFGNLGAFVNGNMFAGLFGSDVGVRLTTSDADDLRALGGGPYGPEERPMGGWVSLPSSMLDDPEAAEWVRRALTHAGTMPPKSSKGQ